MRIFLPLLASIVLLPLHAEALEYSNTSLQYGDAPFSSAESAGISVLTSLGAVEGYPDGTFHPEQTLNRVEFLKIVLESSPDIRVSNSDAEHCFPDVLSTDWFSKYVCLAKKRGIIAGYPDGMFRPGNAVNYAEALKMLGELYGYTMETANGSAWYETYSLAAVDLGVALPSGPSYSRSLTRGQMARLAAAYRTHFEGELEQYRAFENNKEIPPKQESSSSVSSASSSTGSSVSSSSSSVSSQALEPVFDVPTISHLLMVGEQSQPIADGVFTPWSDDGRIRIVTVQLDKEVDSIESMHLVDSQDQEIVVLELDKYDSTDKTWKGTLEAGNPHILPKGEQNVLFIKVTLKPFNQGGVSKALLEVRDFSIVIQNVGDGASSQLTATSHHFPVHQTVAGRLGDVRSSLIEGGDVQSEKHSLLASFTFSGSTVSPAPMSILQLTFDVEQTFGVASSNWELGIAGSPDRHGCFKETATRIGCSSLPSWLSTLNAEDPIELHLYGTIKMLDANDRKTVQVKLTDPGTLGTSGAVWWDDGTGRVTWTEQEGPPLAVGPIWEVRQ